MEVVVAEQISPQVEVAAEVEVESCSFFTIIIQGQAQRLPAGALQAAGQAQQRLVQQER